MDGFDPTSSKKSWLPLFLVIATPQTLSIFGSNVVQFALVWWLMKSTGSALWVSIATVAALLPRSLLNPFIGAYVDRWSRRGIMVGANLIVILCAGILALLHLRSWLDVWHIPLLVFIHSTADTFYSRTIVASTSCFVPKSHLPQVSGITQGLMGLAFLGAPALGAILLETSSVMAVLILDAAVATLAVIPLIFLSIPSSKANADDSKEPHALFRSIHQSWMYLKSWSGALGMLAISATMNVVMQPYFSLISVLAAERGGGEREFGYLGTAVGSGFFIGGLVLGFWPGFQKKMITSLMGIALAGMVLMTTSAMDSWIGFVLCFAAAGMAMPFCMSPIQALIQGSVPSDLQGRVFSIMEAVSTSLATLGLLAAGKLFDTWGPLTWYRWGGLVAMILALAGFLIRPIRNLGHQKNLEGIPAV